MSVQHCYRSRPKTSNQPTKYVQQQTTSSDTPKFLTTTLHFARGAKHVWTNCEDSSACICGSYLLDTPLLPSLMTILSIAGVSKSICFHVLQGGGGHRPFCKTVSLLRNSKTRPKVGEIRSQPSKGLFRGKAPSAMFGDRVVVYGASARILAPLLCEDTFAFCGGRSKTQAPSYDNSNFSACGADCFNAAPLLTTISHCGIGQGGPTHKLQEIGSKTMSKVRGDLLPANASPCATRG